MPAAAEQKEELSLLSGMSAKDRKRLHDKGIFTITQLSYTFRPRRRRRNSSGKREKNHFSLQARAIRENKIHAVDMPAPNFEAGVGSSTEAFACFTCKKKRIIVAGHEKPHQATSADATNANDLDSQVEEMKAVEQDANVIGEGLAITRDTVCVSCLESGSLLFGGMKDQRRVVSDPIVSSMMFD